MGTPGPKGEHIGSQPSHGDVWGWLTVVLDLQPFPSLLIDLKSAAIIHSNQAARSIPLGPPDDAGDPVASFAEHRGVRISSRDLARELPALAAAPEGIEITWHNPGRMSLFRVFCRTLAPSDGHGHLAVLTFQDVTEQRETERGMRSALEVRDEFFSIATHELKDPLFSLKLSTQLLRHTATRLGEIPAHILQHLEVCQRQIDRLSRLVDNLLDVSRLMNHRLQLDVEALDLADLIREVVGRFRAQADLAGTTLAADISGPLIGYFDRLKIEQIVSNLLSNALKYGGGRPVNVRVQGRGDMAVVEIEDQGPGIAPEDRARIFERFERASGGYKKESLGLGLYIVRSLVEAHAGTVDLRSEPGRGATFTVRLPMKRLPGDDRSPAEDETDSTQGETHEP